MWCYGGPKRSLSPPGALARSARPREPRLQRVLVIPHLICAQADSVMEAAGASSSRFATDGPEWDAAKREGCSSHRESKLLIAMRRRGLLEPEKGRYCRARHTRDDSLSCRLRKNRA